MQRLTTRFGSPFHLILTVATATDDGKTLGSNEELFPVLGHFAHALVSSGLGVEGAGFANNLFPLLESVTEDSEMRMLGSPGYMQAEFNAGEVVYQHSAARLASLILPTWATAVDSDDAAKREAETASVNHMDNDVVLLKYAQHDDGGVPFLGAFDAELAASWKRKVPKPKAILAELLKADEAFKARMLDAAGKETDQLFGAIDGYVHAVVDQGRRALERWGPTAMTEVISAALKRVEGILSTLTEQRDGLVQDVADVDAATAAALDVLAAAVASGRRFRGFRKETREAIALLTEANALSHGLALTEGSISVLGTARQALADHRSVANGLAVNMSAVAADLEKSWKAYEGRVVSPVDELVRRPLAEADDLHALYERDCGSPWGEATPQLESVLRAPIGSLVDWLGLPTKALCDRALDSAMDLFRDTLAMSADDFLRWKCERLSQSPDVVLRDLIGMAPILCRYDRSRLPESDSVYDGSFVLVGVPDRDTSVFAGTGHGVLVSTADRTHISVLRLKLGMPASALWDYDRTRHAHEAVRARGEVVLDIYPGLYDEDASDEPHPQQSVRRRGIRSKRARRAS